MITCGVEEDDGAVKRKNKSKNRRRDKSSEKLKDYSDINGALDRM